jgi:hypothetical protein
MSIRVPPLPTREKSPSDRAKCGGCCKKIAFGITRVKVVKVHSSNHARYYHEGCCPPDTVAAMQESEADHPEDIRQKLHFLIDPDETVKQQNLAMSVYLNSMQDTLSSARYALTLFHGGEQEDYIKWKLLKTVAYMLPTSTKELLEVGMDPPVVKKHGDQILQFIAESIKEKEEEMTRADPALAYLRSLLQPVGPSMAPQADGRLRDERSTKRLKTDGATQFFEHDEGITDTLTREEAIARSRYHRNAQKRRGHG